MSEPRELDCAACGHAYELAPEHPFCSRCGEHVVTEFHGEGCKCDACAEAMADAILAGMDDNG